ncbi:protein SON isoform X1 [Chanos chanos]|uniref:Protein SON isoform X1 n=1 Tax=Chanos chanos TaxID=29144 RepID=A0A6J2VR98_CHACN|nr:protein SON isoform X1 [Chanos chanos]
METNIEQIFRDFVMNKIKEIEDESQDTSLTEERHCYSGGLQFEDVSGKGVADSVSSPLQPVAVEATGTFTGNMKKEGLQAPGQKDKRDARHKKNKKHKRHKSKKKKKKHKEEKESSSESGLESERETQMEGSVKKKKRKKKKKRREIDKKSGSHSQSESSSISGTESDSELNPPLVVDSNSQMEKALPLSSVGEVGLNSGPTAKEHSSAPTSGPVHVQTLAEHSKTSNSGSNKLQDLPDIIPKLENAVKKNKGTEISKEKKGRSRSSSQSKSCALAEIRKARRSCSHSQSPKQASGNSHSPRSRSSSSRTSRSTSRKNIRSRRQPSRSRSDRHRYRNSSTNRRVHKSRSQSRSRRQKSSSISYSRNKRDRTRSPRHRSSARSRLSRSRSRGRRRHSGSRSAKGIRHSRSRSRSRRTRSRSIVVLRGNRKSKSNSRSRSPRHTKRSRSRSRGRQKRSNSRSQSKQHKYKSSKKECSSENEPKSRSVSQDRLSKTEEHEKGSVVHTGSDSHADLSSNTEKPKNLAVPLNSSLSPEVTLEGSVRTEGNLGAPKGSWRPVPFLVDGSVSSVATEHIGDKPSEKCIIPEMPLNTQWPPLKSVPGQTLPCSEKKEKGLTTDCEATSGLGSFLNKSVATQRDNSTPSRRQRSRSTSSGYRKGSSSNSSSPRKRSKSPSKKSSKKRKSRSPSHNGKKRSKSRTPMRRKSLTRKRKSRSKSRTRTRHSKSRSPKRKKSHSPVHRRRSKTSDRSRQSKSRSPTRRRSRSRSRSRRSRSSSHRRRTGFGRVLSQRDRWKREPSHSPVLILRKKRSASRTRRSTSKTPPRLTELDKDQLLEIAKANAAAMCAKAGMPIPESLRPKAILQLPLPTPNPSPLSLPLPLPVSLPLGMPGISNMTMSAAMASMTAATMTAALSSMGALAAMSPMAPLPTITNKPPPAPTPNLASIEEAKRKVTKQANSFSIKELTEKCKKIAESKEEMAVAKPHVSDDEDEEKPFGGVALKENKGITFSLNNPLVKPAVRSEAAFAKEFPVSSGSQHRKKEGEGAYGEWVPVDKRAEKAGSSSLAPGGAENQSKDIDSVFPDAPSQPVDITLAVSERAVAQKRLAENPFDVNAMCMLTRAQEQVDAWAQSNTIPGLFTGSTGAQVLSSEELTNSGPQAWIKKDQFLRAAPVSGGMGELLMRKMGWRAGEGLGKHREGTVEPIVIDFKTDRRGLVAEGEKTQKSGNLVVMKDLLGKHPVSALMEMCNKKKWAPPEFVMVHHSGPDHRKNFLFKVVVNGNDYQPQTSSPNKKHAKAMAATVALQAMGEVAGDSVHTGPVFTAATGT